MLNDNLKAEINPTKGIALCVIAYWFVAVFGICEKFISHGVPVLFILFCQNAICLFLIIPILLRRKINIFAINDWQTYVIRIAAGFCCYGTLFFLLRSIPVSEAFLYQYSASLWIPFITLLWMGIPIKENSWFGILIGFAGIAIILKPTTFFFGVVSMIGIICAISQAVSVIAIRKLTVSEPISRVLFYYFLMATILSGILVSQRKFVVKHSDIYWLIAVGMCAFLAQQFLAKALKYAHASTLAPICYTSVVFSGVLDWLIWQDRPDKNTAFGMGMVILGCLLTLSLSRRKYNKMMRSVNA